MTTAMVACQLKRRLQWRGIFQIFFTQQDIIDMHTEMYTVGWSRVDRSPPEFVSAKTWQLHRFVFIYWESTAESKACQIFFAQFFPFILLKFIFKHGARLKQFPNRIKKQPSCEFRCVAWHVFLFHVLQCMNSEIKFTELEKISLSLTGNPYST